MYNKDWKKTRLCIGLCNNQDKIDSSFFWNFLALEKPTNYIVVRGDKTIKSSSLNVIVRQAWEKKCEKVLFMDIDQDFPFDTIPKLLSRNLPIVSGVYHTKKYPYSPVMGWREEDHYVNSEGNPWKLEYAPLPETDDGLVEIDFAGIGCLLVDLDVFNKIKFPAFRDTYDELGERKKGHDILFCDAVKEAGYKVYADTRVQCAHWGLIGVNDLYAKAYHASNMHETEMNVLKAGAQEQPYWDERHFGDKIQNIHRKYTGEFITIKDFIDDGATVADMGCGPGYLMEYLSEAKGCDCYGYDISKVAIDELKAKGLKGEQADLRTFKPNGQKYDAIVSTHTLEHMVDDEGYLRKCAKMLKAKDGKVIMSVPSIDMAGAATFEHQRTYTKDTLTEVMSRVFKDVSILKSDKSANKEQQEKLSRSFVAIGSDPHGI